MSALEFPKPADGDEIFQDVKSKKINVPGQYLLVCLIVFIALKNKWN